MKKKALILMEKERRNHVYGPQELKNIYKLVDLAADAQTEQDLYEHPDILKDVEIIFSGWGMPLLDEKFLSLAPNLKAIFYAASSIRGFMTDAAWARKIIVTSSYGVNAVPVAEYCVASILLALKQAPFFSRRLACGSPEAFNKKDRSIAGAYGSTVGIISLGMTGRKVMALLKDYDLNILVNSQSLSPEEADYEGVESVSLIDIFKRSDAVTIHTALTPETRGMITGDLISSMKENAVLVNTSRGGLIDEAQMIEVLNRRPDLTAILDVTDPEPPVEGSPLYNLSNVFMTPHIAGAQGEECRRMGQFAIEECRRYLSGETLQAQIDKKTFRNMA